MPAKKVKESVPPHVSDIERRFSHLLTVMKERYLAAGYELDDVHLAEILGVHDGVLRKGKSLSVSPALAKAVGAIWQVDLNWLLLGEGEPPSADEAPIGVERLSFKSRIARGRWDEHKVRRLLAEKNLNQRGLSRLLNTDPQRAGNLVRGTLRDPRLRVRLAEILKTAPDSLFLVSRTIPPKFSPGRKSAAGESGKLYSFLAVRRALVSLLDEKLEPALQLQAAGSAAAGYESSEVKISVPPAPEVLSENERKRYEHNREVLERWSRTSGAFEVPAEVAGRYCREVVGFYDGGRVDDVGGILRDFVNENLELGDTRPGAEAAAVKLKKGVLVIGGTEIEVDDPELLAKLPEYLGSPVGRQRLLDWLRKSLGTS
ncbi:MAG: hypothetical protein A3F83_11530 [Candidatus Glassbacteria bacterium RIFCSPLOWO2_12_FULL_58_11]|uniref:HTH cro/C1-type domain-containing protein n=1 Tax=Candidatus Glassbacteria bacterium RIFCSPLOWO2_12_FULL_58_11 TaxID=1817867 RepID=A0A1F5YRJ9_9BACT|nr:MAG: hypothetical protein A3F83_11530 [Candidatus Glassbacteria bacterium RIFCSPLOWO2_12_FULL_58_11]